MADNGNGDNNHDTILTTLQALVRDLEEQNDASSTIQQLQAQAPPEAIMDLLAPLLFRGQDEESISMDMTTGHDDKQLTSSQALAVLVYLVSTNGKIFLEPASSSVFRAATTLDASSSSFVVSPALLQVLTSQITGTQNVQVSTKATAALVACCRKISSLVPPALGNISQAWNEAWR